MIDVTVVILLLTGGSLMLWGLAGLLLPGVGSARRGGIALLVGLALVINGVLYVRQGRQTAAGTGAETTSAVLQQPETVCRLLEEEGLSPEPHAETGAIWSKVVPMYYYCQGRLAVTSEPIPDEIRYRVQSDGGREVDLLRLQADIHNMEHQDRVLTRFERFYQVLFNVLPVSMPAGLSEAVAQRRSRRFDSFGGSVELMRDQYDRGYGLRLEIRPNPQKP